MKKSGNTDCIGAPRPLAGEIGGAFLKMGNCNKNIPEFNIFVNPQKWLVKWQNEYHKSLLLFITGRCDLNCENCFSISSRDDNELLPEQIEKIVDANPDFEKIDLMGGEPLLHSHFSEIVNILKRRGKQISIYTNAIKLKNISEEDMPIRICVSFHEVVSDNRSRKPLVNIQDGIQYFLNKGNPVKLVFLLDRYNSNSALEIIDYVEKTFPLLKKLTIGLMRYENDYWNDSNPGVLSFKEYAFVIQKIVDEYAGRLDLDIFLKGVLRFQNDPGVMYNRVNRFKCVFQNLTYSDCLYNACDPIHEALPYDCKLPQSYEVCKHTGRQYCLADKVRLKNKMIISGDVQ